MNDQTITFYSLQKSIIGYKALHAFKSELTTKQVLPRTKLLQFIIIHMTSILCSFVSIQSSNVHTKYKKLCTFIFLSINKLNYVNLQIFLKFHNVHLPVISDVMERMRRSVSLDLDRSIYLKTVWKQKKTNLIAKLQN